MICRATLRILDLILRTVRSHPIILDGECLKIRLFWWLSYPSGSVEGTSDMAISTVGMHSSGEGGNFAPLSYMGREAKILHNGFV